MFDLFSDIFARRDNFLTRIDARAKLMIALSSILAVICSSKVFLPLAVALMCVWAMMAVGVPLRIVAARIAGPLGIVSALVILQAFLTRGTPIAAFSIGSWDLIASREGLLKGFLMGSRVVGSVSVILLLGSVTPAYKVFQALRWFRVPEGWVELALIMYRYIFALLDQTVDVAAAQSARLGYSGVRRSISSLGVLAGTVITRSMDQAIRTHEAMILRGYDGKMVFGPLSKMRAADRYSACLAIPAIVAVHVMLEWWPA
jgi:cobalt/nickel transport system permease protein